VERQKHLDLFEDLGLGQLGEARYNKTEAPQGCSAE
jgi:hypothetical protein